MTEVMLSSNLAPTLLAPGVLSGEKRSQTSQKDSTIASL